METEEKYFIIHAMGQDRAGLIAVLSKVISKAGYNIIDIEQSAPHGIFYIIMIIEPTEKSIHDPINYFSERFEELSAGTQLNISISPFKGGLRKESKNWRKVIFVGPDRPGMIATISDFTGKNNVNIHRMNMIARGEIIACEILLDVSEIIDDIPHFNEELKKLTDKIGVQLIVEAENVFEGRKKLLILDLNENLIVIQNLKDFIKDLPFNQPSKELLQKLKKQSNQKDYKNHFIEYLKDLDIEFLKSIITTVKISPGTEEMIRAFKLMNYKIALISNSLNYFVDILKERLSLDYAFSTTLEIKNGICTGKFVKSLEIDGKKKSNLVNWLATMEKIPDVEIYEYGLDEKEPMFSHSAGLKISIDFDYKKISELIKNKKIRTEQVLALFILIGLEESQVNNLISLI